MAVINYPADVLILILNGFPIMEFAEGDYVTLEPQGEVTVAVNSAGGGTAISQPINSFEATLTIRVQRNSGNDALLNLWRNAVPALVFDGAIKTLFTRDSVPVIETVELRTMHITEAPGPVLNNMEPEHVSEWKFRVREAKRKVA